MAELVLGSALALFVSVLVLYLTRGTAITQVCVLDGGADDAAVGSDLFAETFGLLTNTPLCAGSRVELLVNGDQTFSRLWAELETAESLITWQVFWLKPGKLAERACDVLTERARAGVQVLFLLDAYGSRGLPDSYARRLRDAGVRVAVFRPLNWRTLYKVQQRMHIRSVVIDGRVGFTGGFGIDDRWQGDGRHPGQWRDTNVRLHGPAVNQLQVAFAANWAEATGELLLGDRVFARVELAAGGVREAGIMYGSPSLGSTNVERLFALAVAAARERLYITNAYFVPGAALRRFLIDAAARGVDVRVLTPGRNTDRMSAWYAARAHYEELIAGGVRIYEYRPAMVHAKTLVADGAWSCVGTANFDNRSMVLNDEVEVVVRDADFGSRLERIFLEDLSFADEVDLRAVRARPWTDRAVERAAHLVAPLL